MRAIIASWAFSSSSLMRQRVASYIGVHMPGATAFTVIPWRAHSFAIVRVQPSTAAFDAE